MSEKTPENSETPGAPVEIEAEPVAEAPSSAPAAEGADARAARPSGPRSLARAPAFLIVGVLVLAIAVAGVWLARRQLDRAPADEIAADTRPPATPTATLESLREERRTPNSPHAVASTPPDKIFNQTDASLKSGAEAVARIAPSVQGAINELPSPPAAAGGNEGLQEAARDAAKMFSPDSREIDLSVNSVEALDDLERAAGEATAIGEPPRLKQSGSLQGAETASVEIANLSASLMQERQRTDRQASVIARLEAEVSRLKAIDEAAAGKARALAALTKKMGAGEPYRRELDAYAKAGGVPAASIEASADDGLATMASLMESFPEARDRALAASRRENARGPGSRIGANFAAFIRLRPAQPIEGGSAGAVLSRAEANLAGGDLAGAVGELAALTGGAREAMAPWAERARARVAAEAALSALTGAETTAPEGGPAP